MSLYEPQPKFVPKRLPRQQPIEVVPSYIGEKGLVGNWLFYNGGGDTLYDYSGKGNHGDINGAKWTDKEQAGWALDFDGVDDYVDVPNNAPPKTHNITVCAWINSSPTGHDEPTESIISFSGQYQLRLMGYDDWYTGTTGDAWFGFYNGSTMLYASSNKDLRGAGWTHLAGVYVPNQSIKLYVNGELQATTNVSSLPVDATKDNSIGQRGDGSKFFNGSIDDVRIYNRALSDTEIKKIYEGEKVMFK